MAASSGEEGIKLTDVDTGKVASTILQWWAIAMLVIGSVIFLIVRSAIKEMFMSAGVWIRLELMHHLTPTCPDHPRTILRGAL